MDDGQMEKYLDFYLGLSTLEHMLAWERFQAYTCQC